MKCQQCGKPIVYSGHGRPPSKFCSRACKEAFRSAAQHDLVLQKRREQRCVQCSGPIPLDAGPRVRACSRKCGDAWQNAKKAELKRVAKQAEWLANRPVCQREQCGNLIPESRPRWSKYCSPKCKKDEMDARWRARAPHYNRQYKYGISQAEYEAQMEAQGSRCAICGSADWPGKGPHTDHDHMSGVFRGILCGNCNNGLGMFGEDPARLRAAADYLEREM